MTQRIAVNSSHDIVEWFQERSSAEGRMLDGLRLQRLLFLAQAHFAAISGGARLMPSVFLIGERGPVDPNLLRTYGNEAVEAGQVRLRQPIVDYLKGIWRLYGTLPPSGLDATVLGSDATRAAIDNGANTEVTVAAMGQAFASAPDNADLLARLRGADTAPAKPAPAPRYHKGKPVERWTPGQKRSDTPRNNKA